MAVLLLSCNKTDNAKRVVLEPAELQWLNEHREELYFAPDPFYAPFEFYDEKDGLTKGLAHDYIKLIEEKIGFKFKIIKVSSFDEILSLAQHGGVAIVNAATKTPERSEYLLFTEPIVEIRNAIFVRKDTVSSITLADLAGKRVSLVKGYAITEYIEKNYPEIICDLVSSDLNAILNVSYRFSDAAVIDLATASYLAEKEGISNIQVSGDAGYPIQLAIGSRKDWPELNSILIKGLSAITPEERAQIYKRWISFSDVSFLQSREFKIAALLIVMLFAVSGFVLLWNKQLKKQIQLRTENLKSAVNDLRISEAALRESEKHFRTLADSGDALIWTSGTDGNCNYFNQPWLSFTGRTLEQEFGDGWVDGVHSEDKERCVNIYSEAFGRREKFSMEYRLRNNAGEYRWLQDDGTPRYSSNGEFLGYIGHCLDITERRFAEERVRTLLSEKELLLREVHHRIKNNMNTIKGLLNLQISAEENESAAESLRDAEGRVQSMIMLYERLYCTDNYRELSVKDYIQPLTAEIVGSFPNRTGISIETCIGDFILNVQILTPLGIIINELLTNMMKHAFKDKDQGLIIVSVLKEGSTVIVSVQDNGVGIPDFSGAEKSKGFGLDLVDMLVAQIGGSVKIERNEGTKFVLEFEV